MKPLTTIIHYCHPDGSPAFNASYSFTINEERISTKWDNREFLWKDDGKDIELVKVKYTYPKSGLPVEKFIVEDYFELYMINEIQHLLESAAIAHAVDDYLKELDEQDEKEAIEDYRVMQKFYNQLNQSL